MEKDDSERRREAPLSRRNDPPPDAQLAVMKQAFKEAHKEWLDEKAAEFGRFSARWIAFAALAALMAMILNHKANMGG